VLADLSWRIFPKVQFDEGIQARLTEAPKDRSVDGSITKTEDGEHIIVHWQALARLRE